MPLLTYTNADAQALTIARASYVNTRYNDIKTLLNTTGLDDTNFAANGITRSTKLKTGTAKAIVVNDSSTGAMSELVAGNSKVITTDSSGVPTAAAQLLPALGGTGQNFDPTAHAYGHVIQVNSGSTAFELAPPVLAMPTGGITAYAGTTAPTGYLLCDGSAVSRTTYANLYAIIGNAFGQGDNSTTFNVPDMRGMFIRGRVNKADQTFPLTDVNTSTDTITLASHGFNRTGFKIRFSTSGGLPGGLSAGTTYYIIVASANTFKVADTLAHALAGTAIDITSQGTGTHTISQYESPDASTRVANSVGGNSGDNIGSFQEGGIESHAHTSIDSYNVVASGATALQMMLATSSGANGPRTTNLTGGNETRPVSIALTYLIKT